MSTPASPLVVDALRQYQLVEPAQLEEVAGNLQARFAEGKALARELLGRNWITAFQANHILQGKAHQLVLGPYVLLERLGEGGMGEVFKAKNRKLNMIVALKLIRKERLTNPGAIKRFYREIQAASKLEHPNIVRAIDADQVNGTHFFVMEYVDGIDLHKLVKSQGPLDVRRACDYIRQAALGLQHAFERGLVHRDIKPHNLLLSQARIAVPVGKEGQTPPSGRGLETGGQGLVKILDMGLALSAAEADERSSTMTQEGAIMGTPDYIAPEQGLDSHRVDTRADLYSLGCTLHFLLTGQAPFPGGTLMEKLFKHQQEAPTPLRQLRSDVPAAVEAVASRLLAKHPNDRFQTPAELAVALTAAVSGTATAIPVAVVAQPAAAVTESASTSNAFAELAGGKTPSSSELIQRFTRSNVAAGSKQTALVIGLGAAAAIVAVILLVTLVHSLSQRGKPPADDADKVQLQPKKKRGSDGQTDDDKQQQEAERKKKLEEEQKELEERKQWFAQEEKIQKQRNAEAEKAYPALKAKFKEPAVTFASFAREVQAFKSKYGGTPAALGAQELLRQLPSPFDQFEATKLSEDALSVWRAMGRAPPKELVGVFGEHRGRHWGSIGSVQLGGAQKNIIVSRSGATAYLWSLSSRQPLAILPPADLWALSPDGLSLAAATHDGILRLYHVDSGKEAWQADAFPRCGIRSLTFSPDSRILATGGGLNRAGAAGGNQNPYAIKLWTSDTAKLLAVSNTWDNQVITLSYSPDAHVIAAWSNSGSLGLFDPRTAQLQKSLGVFPGTVSFVFSPDSKFLAVQNGSGGKSALQVFDLNSTKNLLKVADLSGDSGHLAFSPDSRWLCHGESGSTIRMWRVPDFELARTWQAHKEGGLTSFLFTRDSDQLWTSSGWNSGEIKIWETESGRKVKTIAGYESNTARHVTALNMSADGNIIAWSCGDNSVRLWDVPKKAVLATIKLNSTGPYLIAPDGMHLITADLNAVRVWSLDSFKEVQPLTGAIGEVWNVAIDPFDRFVATLNSSGTARLWDIAKGVEQHAFPSNFKKSSNVMNDLTFTPDGKSLLVPQAGGQVRLWDLSDPDEHADTTAPGEIVSLAVSPDGGTLAIGTFNGFVYLKGLAKGDQKHQLDCNAPNNQRREVFCLAFSPDGRTLAAGTWFWEKPLHLFDVESGKEVETYRGQEGHVYCVAFSPDGRLLACGSSDGSVRLWEIGSGKAPKVLRGHRNAVARAVFSPDSKLVFSAGHDGRIVFWDGALGAKLVEWQFPGSVFDLALSADGRHLAASNANGTTTIFRVPENLRAPGTLTTTQAKARQQQAAKNLAVAKEIRNSLGMKLNLIPAGRFIMGSSDDEADRKANESPYHVKRISQPFYLGIHPVTVGQFRKFVQVTKYRTEAEKDGQGGFSRATGEWKPDPKSTWLNPEFSQEDDHPVVNVSLEDAAAFCRWLSAKEKKVYRLPTEAEWEVACRAGTQTPFSFGATLDAKQANIMVKIGKTTKVGAYSANPFGLYDMHGNVSQWCADPYQDSYLHDIFGVEALTPGQNLPGVSRGGNWSSVARACRCAFRENHARNYRSSALGFRVVCVIGSEGSRQEK